MLNYTVKKDKNGNSYLSTSHRDKELLSIPRLNKGTAFTQAERREFGLLGKLPYRVETLDEQLSRAYTQYQSFEQLHNRNAYLNRLLNYNQILFYKLVINNITEMLPTIYTPMVGDFVQTYNKRFMNPRGLYISYEDQDRLEEILENRTNKEIQLIVMTDGEGVLGIGDQGIGSMAIAIAKLMVYTIFGGVNPDVTLPIYLDVGTNNKKLLDDPFYLGWRHERISGEKYNAFIDKFINVITKKFPNVFLHWEDFGRVNAHRNLVTYRNSACSFNDDIQGTGIVALAAVISSACKTNTRLQDQRIVVFGGGSAGMGVTENIYKGFVQAGIAESEAKKQFYIVDRYGLVTEYVEEITSAQKDFLTERTEVDTWSVKDKSNISLLEVIKAVKPTILIGASAQTGAFTEEMIREMAKHVKNPIILPLSNPNERAEATPENLIRWTEGRAHVATGSPFPEVTYQSKTYPICQCNNYLAFPGLGLGIVSAGAKRLTDSMMLAASHALGKFADDNCETLLPTIVDASRASRAIALAVAKVCLEENNTTLHGNKSAEALIKENEWEPQYLPYKYEPTS